jgi:hypothetical protein
MEAMEDGASERERKKEREEKRKQKVGRKKDLFFIFLNKINK